MRFEVSLALNALIVLVEVVALYLFLNGFLDKRATSKTPFFGMYAAYFLCALISSQFVGIMLVNTVVSVIFPFAIALVLYSGGFWSRIVAASLSIAYHFIVEPLSAMLIKLVSGDVLPGLPDWNYFYFIGAGIAVTLYILIAIMLSKRRVARAYRLGTRSGALLLAMVVICCFLAYAEMMQINNSAEVHAVQIIAEFAIGGMAVFVYYAFEKVQETIVKEMLTTMIERQMADMRTQFEIIAEHDRELRTIKHDLTNQLAVLRRISESDSQPELSEIAQSLAGYIEGVTRQVITGITVIDALIEIKKEKAEAQGTEFIVKASEARNIIIDPVDLNVVIGNALDNAIEACTRLQAGQQRRVELALKNEDEFLYIRITNTAPPVKKILNGLPVSSKRRGDKNGYGLESIRSIVERYNGIFIMNPSDGGFSLQLRMQNAYPPHEKNPI